MTITEIFNVNECRLVEPSFSELTQSAYTDLFLQTAADEARLLVDEDEEPIALALHNDYQGWQAVSFLFRDPTLAAIESFEEIGGDIYQEEREVWLSAVRKHYSCDILRNTYPSIEDLSPDREKKIRDLVDEVWGDRTGDLCLDCCCGSGVGTMALRNSGMQTLAYDIDPTLLALGLSRDRLVPEETMCIDAREASKYTRPAPLGAVFMAGEIYIYNATVWESIVSGLLALTDEVLITLRTKAEATLTKGWCADLGWDVEVFENRRDQLYDRWCCIAQRA